MSALVKCQSVPFNLENYNENPLEYIKEFQGTFRTELNKLRPTSNPFKIVYILPRFGNEDTALIRFSSPNEAEELLQSSSLPPPSYELLIKGKIIKFLPMDEEVLRVDGGFEINQKFFHNLKIKDPEKLKKLQDLIDNECCVKMVNEKATVCDYWQLFNVRRVIREFLANNPGSWTQDMAWDFAKQSSSTTPTSAFPIEQPPSHATHDQSFSETDTGVSFVDRKEKTSDNLTVVSAGGIKPSIPTTSPSDDIKPKIYGEGHLTYIISEWFYTTKKNCIIIEEDMLTLMSTRGHQAFKGIMANVEKKDPKRSLKSSLIKFKKLIAKDQHTMEALLDFINNTAKEIIKVHIPLLFGLVNIENGQTKLSELLNRILKNERTSESPDVIFFNQESLFKGRSLGLFYDYEVYFSCERKKADRLAKELQFELRKIIINLSTDSFVPVLDYYSFDLLASSGSSTTKPCRCKILLYEADIVKIPVDAIVNGANDRLQHGAGVAKAISQAAGPQFQIFCNDYIRNNNIGSLNTGDAIYTPAMGNLPCLYVIHVVGPNSQKIDSSRIFKGLLKTGFKNAFQSAYSIKCRSIAIPLISTGIYRGDMSSCAKVLWETLIELREEISAGMLEELHIVDNNADKIQAILMQSRASEFENIISRCSDRSYSRPPKLIKSTNMSKLPSKQRTVGWNNQGDINSLTPAQLNGNHLLNPPFITGTTSLPLYCAKDLDSHSLSIAIFRKE